MKAKREQGSVLTSTPRFNKGLVFILAFSFVFIYYFVFPEKLRGEMAVAMITREELQNLFTRFSSLVSQPETKKRISEAVENEQDSVAVTTAIKEEIFLEMGIDPGFGLSCLGNVNPFYENDRELMLQFYKFVAMEEMACDEARLEPDEFTERIQSQHALQEQQLEMLKLMRKFALDDQSAILEKLHKQMQIGNFESEVSVLSSEKIQEIVKRRVSPLYEPR